MVRDWFREQVLALGADYKVNPHQTPYVKLVTAQLTERTRSTPLVRSSPSSRARTTASRPSPWAVTLILLLLEADLTALWEYAFYYPHDATLPAFNLIMYHRSSVGLK